MSERKNQKLKKKGKVGKCGGSGKEMTTFTWGSWGVDFLALVKLNDPHVYCMYQIIRNI